MTTIITRAGKGSPLEWAEVDANFTNLDSDKVEKTAAAITGGTINNTVIGNTTPNAATFTTLNTNGLTTLRNTSGTNVAVLDDGVVSDRYAFVRDTGGGAYLRFNSGGGGLRNATANGVTFQTNNGTTQLSVAHTASAVNFVQVTGAATGARPVISAQGSDSNVSFDLNAKGVGAIRLQSGNANIMRLNGVASAANFLDVFSSAAGASPRIVAEGTDTNIDLALTPKGTGNVRFGTYTANMALTIQGYVEIKDSGGTIRRLAVIA